MLKPYGIENRKKTAYLIQENGLGFWLLSQKDRLFGEAQELQKATNKLQEFEITNAWLVIQILDENYEALKNEYINLSPDDPRADAQPKEVLEKIDTAQLRVRLEIYVRRLIREFQISHPVLTKYKVQINQTISENNVFDYQTMVIFACLKYRLVNDIAHLKIDEDDPEKATILDDGFIGCPDLKIEDFKSPDITEQLLTKVYRFADTEHSQQAWQTSKMIAKSVVKLEAPPVKDNDEKKVLSK